MLSDLEIARGARYRPMLEIAAEWGILHDELEPHGWFKGKLNPSILKRLAERPRGRLGA